MIARALLSSPISLKCGKKLKKKIPVTTAFPSSRDLSGQLQAEITILVKLRTAVVTGPIEVCLLDLRWADSNCHDRMMMS